MNTGRIFRYFVKAISKGLFSNGTDEWAVAGKELISKRTFRLPDDSYHDHLIGLRLFIRTFKNLNCEKRSAEGKRSVLILDSNQKVYDLRKNYILKVKNYSETEITGMTRDVSFAFVPGWPAKLYLFLLSLFILPATFFSKNRVQWSLIFPEFVEIVAAVQVALTLKVKQVHFFSPAEKDANLFYLILREAGLKVTKHPSPGALISHNKSLMADVLAISSNYQQEEYNIELDKTIRVSSTESWPPETALNYMDLYKGEKKKYDYKLGFYSHGGWWRVKDGKTSGLFAKPEEEEKCLDMLSEYLKINPSEKVILFLHPKEKGDLAETEKYYSKWFNKTQIEYFTEKTPSSHAFDRAQIGIGSYSTILFERDYFGFKTLILREDDRNFPLKGTKFYQHSFVSGKDLAERIKEWTD